MSLPACAARTVTASAKTLTVGGVVSGAFGLTKSGVGIDRKALAELALNDMDAFKAVFERVRALGATA